MRPPGTVALDTGVACETDFSDCSGDSECDVEIAGSKVPLQRVSLTVPAGVADLGGLLFVLRRCGERGWCWEWGEGGRTTRDSFVVATGALTPPCCLCCTPTPTHHAHPPTPTHHSGDSTRWYRDAAGNFFVPIPTVRSEEAVEVDPMTRCEGAVDVSV